MGGEAVGEVGVDEGVPHESGASTSLAKEGASRSEDRGVEAEKGCPAMKGS